MWAFWICLFLLHGPTIHNSEVTRCLFRPRQRVEPGALSPLWEDGIMQGSKVFTGVKHLRE